MTICVAALFSWSSFAAPAKISAAAQCGSGVSQEVVDCQPTPVNGQCLPSKVITHQYTCSTQLPGAEGSCKGVVIGARCVDNGLGGCRLEAAGQYVFIDCGGGGGDSCTGPDGGPCSGTCSGGGPCRPKTAQNGGACGCHPKPSDDGRICETTKDCRKGGCTGGTTPADGCSGCKDGQSCCKRTTCCIPEEPSAPTLNLPINGSSTTSTTVTLSWNPPADWGDDCLNNNNKQFEVSWGEEGSTPFNLGVYASTKYSTPFTGVAGKTYYWKVTAINGTKEKSSAVRWFKISENTISGTVYYDPGNSCSTALGWNKGAGLTAQLTNPGTRTANIPSGGANAGKFSITAPNGTFGSLRLLGLPNTFKCSTACSQLCPNKAGVVSPSIGNNFFITDQILSTEGWWQAVGGPVYAGSTNGGTTIRSQLPQATDKLILPGSGGGTDSVLMRASGNVDLGPGSVSSSGWSTKAAYKGRIMDYNYFAAALGVIKGQASDWTSNVIDLANYPTTHDFGYSKPPTGTANLSSNWNVATGQKYTIFVDGDLRINYNISVAPGGFLAMIVKRDISVGTGVSNIEGLFVASGDFISLSQYVSGTTNDIPLNVEGSVVAWGAVDLRRNLGGIANTNQPAEKFTHRPDFLINMPQKMKTFAMQWQEVPAGSF